MIGGGERDRKGREGSRRSERGLKGFQFDKHIAASGNDDDIQLCENILRALHLRGFRVNDNITEHNYNDDIIVTILKYSSQPN